jgi:crotonobetainyl-CoA hydratase/dehydration protein DpgD
LTKPRTLMRLLRNRLPPTTTANQRYLLTGRRFDAATAYAFGLVNSADLPLPDAFDAHYRWEDRRRHSADAVEGVRAFVDRRPPYWSGK